MSDYRKIYTKRALIRGVVVIACFAVFLLSLMPLLITTSTSTSAALTQTHEGSFPFLVTYSHFGETMTIENEVICQINGVNAATNNVLWFRNLQNAQNARTIGGLAWGIPIYEGEDFEIFLHTGTCHYFMNGRELEDNWDLPTFVLLKQEENALTPLSVQQLSEYFNISVNIFEFSPPLSWEE